MNIELLNKVRRHILARPSRLRMSNWIVDIERLSKDTQLSHFVKTTVVKGKKALDFRGHVSGWNEPEVHPLPECNTVGCIAGWTCILAGFKTQESLQGYGVQNKAEALLDIASWEAQKLFYVDSWPQPFKADYLSPKTKTAVQRARIAAKRIDYFIKTNGEDYE